MGLREQKIKEIFRILKNINLGIQKNSPGELPIN